MDYEKNVCPYDAGTLFTAHKVLEWAFGQDIRLNNSLYTRTILEAIDNVIMNEVVRQVRVKRLEDYTTLELEQELERRNSNEKDNV